MIEFGVVDHIDFQQIPIHQTFDERMEQIVQYERDGFYAFHVTEHHFTPHGLASSPIAFLSAVSRLTKRIKLIPTVLVIPTYHPLRLAEEICMLDQLSHGRVEFGVGRGIVPHELSLFGINPPEAADMLKEGLDVLMQALTKASVTYRGHYHRFSGVPMSIRPYSPFEDRKMWVVSGQPDAVRQAGRNGDNILTLMNPQKLKRHLEVYQEGWNETHDSDVISSKVGFTRHVFVAESQAEANERGEFGFSGWFDNHSWMWNRYDPTRGHGSDQSYRDSHAMLFGTPEYVRNELREYLEASGNRANYFVPRFAFGNLTQEEVLRSYALFRDEVMPHFKDVPRQAQRAA